MKGYSNLHYIAAAQNLPAYLKKTDYRQPSDMKNNNYSDMDKDGLNFFDRCQASPEYLQNFIGHMEAYTA
jgi:hypothetical protein